MKMILAKCLSEIFYKNFKNYKTALYYIVYVLINFLSLTTEFV
jgi:hypothetical protein